MGRPKLTKKEITKQVEDLGLIFIDFILYDGKDSKFYVQCSHKHDAYETTLSILKKKRKALGCPSCKKINKSIVNINKVGFEKVSQYFKTLGYTLLTNESEYIGIDCELKIVCPNGHNINVSYDRFKKRKIKCKCCHEEEKVRKAILRAKELGYEIEEFKYDRKMTNLNIVCEKGHNWHPTYESFVYCKNKCLYCQYSKGEEEIKRILNKNNIKFIQQFSFDDCIYKRKLKFDFYLPEYKCCIEFDGVQHFEEIEYFGGLESYEDLKIKDNIKNKYCKDNDIKLVRISYQEINNIEKILELELK